MRAIRPAVEAEGLPRDGAAQVSRQLCASVLASLRRRDQRHKGELYVNGLLNTPGRKTMRNLAASTDERSAEQSLHHFISCSTWDWVPLRAELTARLDRVLAPRAWVVRPLVIPKTGRHSVGVGRRFVPQLGQVVNSQQGYGLWLASGAGSVPVNWRLSLSGDWLEDAELRQRAAIPDSLAAGAPEQLAVDMVLETAGWGASAVPVVADAREEAVLPLAEALSSAGLPFLLRIGGGTGLLAPDLSAGRGPAVSGPAGRLAELARTQRRPVEWFDPQAPGLPRTSLVALLPVRLPGRAGPWRHDAVRSGGRAAAARLTLVGVWSPSRREVSELWLTSLTGASRSTLMGLGRMVERADADFTGTSLAVGALDFEGRSFHGWHRHVTLVSLAHALRLLGSGTRHGGAAVTPVPIAAGRVTGGRRARGRFGPAAVAGRAAVPVPAPVAASHGRAAG